MGKDAKWKNKGGKKSDGGDKPKPVKAAVAKGADGKPAMQSLGDALKHKPGYKAGGGKGSAGAGKGANKSYKKSWEKSAKKYNADKKDNDSAANFNKHGGKKGGKKEEDNSSRLVKSKTLKAERAKGKPNFELVEAMKTSWNKVRTKSTPEAEKQELLVKMAAQMKGHVMQVTLRHDASRITQSLLQFGNAEQRQEVLAELLEKVVEIAKTPYGHFALLKAISYCTSADDQKKICHALAGHFVSLGTNVIGARTVESVSFMFPNKMTQALRSEFYGKRFTLLMTTPPTSLQSVIDANPNKKAEVLDHMRDMVQKFLDKGLLEFRYAHDLIWEYCQASVSMDKRMEDLTGQLCDMAPKLITTKAGARTMCHLITAGGAKERKRVMKSLKGKVLESLMSDSGHLALMRLVDVSDDTVSVQKMLLDELKSTAAVEKYTATGDLIGLPVPPLVSVATNRMGRKLLMRLLSPSSRHLEPDEESLFGASATSKKDPAMRRNEHLSYLRAAMTAVFSKFAGILARDTNGCRVLELAVGVFYEPKLLNAVACAYAGVEAAVEDDADNDSDSGSDSDSDSDDSGSDDDNEDNKEGDEEKKKAKEVVQGLTAEENAALTEGAADAADSDSDEEEEKEVKQQLPIEEDKIAHTCLKRMLAIEAAAEVGNKPSDSSWADDAPTEQALAALLFDKVQEQDELLSRWMGCNRGCFALAAMLNVPSAKKAIAACLGQARNKKLLQSGGAGAKAVLEAIGGKKAATPAKKKTPAKAAPVEEPSTRKRAKRG